MIYLGDTSGLSPIITQPVQLSENAEGETMLTWHFDKQVGFLGNGRFEIFLGVGDESVGSDLPLSLEMDTPEFDGDASNNSFEASIRVLSSVYLPLSIR